ncbi:unnamed protein product [Brugia pahangi]|uniref:Pao retrotransposon peptidase family protein n=1 Tax=Brugia pahangi TaxID=6280 RepID=A0A0N4TTP7_BRUPA|nr:unnamed protein product [Brugia pahangi]
MNVREFLSNDQTFNEQLPKSDRARMSQIKKILGIKWNPHKDHIQITLNPWTEQTTTKRTILRFIASQYDPLGFLVPLIVPFKIFLQELWRKNIHWDQPLDNQLIETWNNLVVKCPTHIKEIPRFTIDLSQQITFHVFTDASTVAYAAVVYAHQNTHTSLLFAKSRLAPIKGMTIPKLELLAILIGVRAAQFVIKQMELENPKVVVWSDSRCALHWIQNNSRLLPKFIQNRVEEIQMAKFAYRYIPSEHNPADIATRGTIPTRLISYEPWWSGPTWINGNEPNWPHWEYDVPQEEDNEEDKNIVATTTTEEIINTNRINLLEAKRFSKWTKMIRTTVRVLKFLKKLSKGKLTWLSSVSERNPITPEDYNLAAELLIKQSQSEEQTTIAERQGILIPNNISPQTQITEHKMSQEDTSEYFERSKLQELGEWTKKQNELLRADILKEQQRSGVDDLEDSLLIDPETFESPPRFKPSPKKVPYQTKMKSHSDTKKTSVHSSSKKPIPVNIHIPPSLSASKECADLVNDIFRQLEELKILTVEEVIQLKELKILTIEEVMFEEDNIEYKIKRINQLASSPSSESSNPDIKSALTTTTAFEEAKMTTSQRSEFYMLQNKIRNILSSNPKSIH